MTSEHKPLGCATPFRASNFGNVGHIERLLNLVFGNRAEFWLTDPAQQLCNMVVDIPSQALNALIVNQTIASSRSAHRVGN